MWPSGNRTIFYKLYTATVLLIFFVCYTTFKCLYLSEVKSVSETTYLSFVSLTEMTLFVKILLFLHQNDIVRSNQEYLEKFVAVTSDEKEICERNMMFFWKMAISYGVLTNLTSFLSFLVPLTASEPSLPFLAWYPVDWQHQRHIYWMVYWYQVIGMLIQCNTLVCIEMYVVYLMITVSTYLEVLGHRLTLIGIVQSAQEIDTNTFVAAIRCHKYIHRFDSRISIATRQSIS